MRSKLSAITARTPKSNGAFAAQSRDVYKRQAFLAKQRETCFFINKAIAANGSREVERGAFAHARKRVQREIGRGGHVDAISGAQCGNAPKRAAKIGRSERNARPARHRDAQRTQHRRNGPIERARVAGSNAHGFTGGYLRNELGE